MKEGERIKVNPKSCFLNLSYTSGGAPSRIELIIKDYFEKRGFEVKTGRMIPGGEKIDLGILNLIKSCVFGIVVYNELRHNISYEWGIMDGLGMYVIPFRDKDTHIDIDSDLSDKKDTNFIFYSGDSEKKDIIMELENNENLKAAMKKVEEITAEKIGPIESEEVKEAARLLTESNVSLGATLKIKRGAVDTSAVSASLSSIPGLTAEGHFYLANAYYDAGDLKNAGKEYGKAIGLDPKDADVHNNLGNLLSDLKRYTEAEKEYREAIRIDSEFAEAHNNLGILLYDLKRYTEAEKEYREAIRIDSEFAEAHGNLGNLLYDLKRHGEAEKEYRKAIELDPNDADTHNSLGILFYKSKKYKEAEKEYREAIRIDSEFAEAYINLWELYIITKNYEKTFAIEKNALKFAKEDQDIIYANFLKIYAHALQNKKKEMNSEIDNLLKILKTMKKWDLEYDFLEIKTALESLDKDTKSLIFSLIDLLENKITIKNFSRK